MGDMGSGLAKNLLKAGFTVVGFDLNHARLDAFASTGGFAVDSVAEVGNHSDAVYVMVMNGQQAREVILGPVGLVENMDPDATVILSSTINPSEARAIDLDIDGTGIRIIDSPVAGGFDGAQNGTLTLMAAGDEKTLDENEMVMQAVSRSIHRVGNKVGDGQIVKACLQSLIGAIFSATFETAALAAKAGVSGEVIYNVFSTSGAGCGVVNTSLKNIIDRKFFGTGSHISTMHKDLTIALGLAQELEVPMQSAATAMQIFQAGKSKYPGGDNWICTRVIEDIIGAELHR